MHYDKKTPEKLLELYKALLILKSLHKDGSYKNHYESKCKELESEILSRIKNT